MRIINLLTGEPVNRIADATTYTLNADASYKIQISEAASVSVEVVWASLSAANATATLQVSELGDKPRSHPSASAITMTGTNGTSGWQDDLWCGGFLHVALVKNSVASGTVRLLVTVKPR